MKTILVTIALMASAQSFAQFNPLQKLEAGRANYKKTLEANQRDADRIEAIKQQLAERAIELSTKNPIEVTAVCSKDLIRNTKEMTNVFTNANQNEVIRMDKKLEELEVNVGKYMSAEQCDACDADIRQETLERYAGKINQNVEDLGRFRELNSQEATTQIMKNTSCKFDQYFSITDSAKFIKLKNWSFGDYRIGLNSLDILSNEYDETIEYITRHAPIDLKRGATRIGKANSVFRNGSVRITLEYDYSFITGHDNVTHPEGNPVKIIHSALK